MTNHNNDLPQWLLGQQIALVKFGELALRSDDLDEILTEACRLVGDVMGTNLAKVVELQPDGHTLLVRAGVGWQPGVIGKATIQATDDTSEGVALKTGEPMISPDITKETRFRYPPFLIENNVRAISNVIIIGEEGQPAFGILQVDSHEPRQFTRDDTVFLRTYANLLGATVVRLRGYEKLEAKTRELIAKTQELTVMNAILQAEAEERARVEAVLHQAQKMEAVSHLTGGLAHDFNNLLGGISGNLELIRTRLAQGRAAKLEHYIETAIGLANRAAALTHRLLAFSRHQTFDQKATDLNRLVDGMEDMFRRTVGPSIRIRTKLTLEPWVTMCDPNQVESALLNLVINARDAMPHGGDLEIETANIAHLDQRASGGTAFPESLLAGDYESLSVTDTGTGMTPSVLERAFNPFFTTKPIGQGTGLGLSMIHGFAQQSGGDVQLRSKEGHGTTATIYLPRHLGPVRDEVEAATVEILPSRTGAVVLLVDDESTIREVIVDLLVELGYKILEADDGAAGLAIVEKTIHIDLLITDIGLPGINGRQLADAARRRRPDLKVLFITGYSERVLIDKGVLEKGMQVIMKPFPIASLAARVQGMLSG